VGCDKKKVFWSEELKETSN